MRCALAVILFAAGFALPYLFLLSALIAWSIYGDLTRKPDPPSKHHEWQGEIWANIEADPDWKQYFLARCESPAEEAFLEAAIEAYRLRPKRENLEAAGIVLKIQAEVAPYRVDFLANQWLVVEIDGAAYHSSPEAIEKDRIRDKYLESRGYNVLRIPAKVVFETPSDAVESVNSMLARGRKDANGSATHASLSLLKGTRDRVLPGSPPRSVRLKMPSAAVLIPVAPPAPVNRDAITAFVGGEEAKSSDNGEQNKSEAPPTPDRKPGQGVVEFLLIDPPLLRALRSWRGVVAKAQGVPPYAIFHDRALAEIAAARPRSREALNRLSGLSEVKIDRYGAGILSVVASFSK